jgi:hypothetical protein
MRHALGVEQPHVIVGAQGRMPGLAPGFHEGKRASP